MNLSTAAIIEVVLQRVTVFERHITGNFVPGFRMIMVRFAETVGEFR